MKKGFNSLSFYLLWSPDLFYNRYLCFLYALRPCRPILSGFVQKVCKDTSGGKNSPVTPFFCKDKMENTGVQIET